MRTLGNQFSLALALVISLSFGAYRSYAAPAEVLLHGQACHEVFDADEIAPVPADDHENLAVARKVMTLADLLIAASADLGPSVLATHTDWEHDRRLSQQNWSGDRGPKIFDAALPPGTAFIDHPQRDPTEDGLVKSDTGEFTSLRVNLPFNGEIAGTNIGVRKSALFDNLERTQKTLVTKNAKAVIIYLHGGGTATTGHHVAFQILNHFVSYDVDVISLDLGWHGEGPRTEFRSEKQYFEWLRQLIRTYVTPSGKPVFIAGHSMGGELADRYMRLYPKDDLVAGVMPISSVPDLRPGGTIADRVQAMPEMMTVLENPQQKAKVSHDDLNLMDSLLLANKTAPLGLFFEAMFALSNDWSMPANQGADLIPALYIWGEHDWLWVGKEHLINEFIQPLKNVTLRTYDLEHDIDHGPNTMIGHINIFDIKDYPVFREMREFMQRVSGIELPLIKTGNEGVSKQSTLLRNFIQTYANNLAFRKFYPQFLIRRRLSAPGFDLAQYDARRTQLVGKLKILTRRIGELKSHNKKDSVEFQEASAQFDIDTAQLNEVYRYIQGIPTEPQIEAEFNLQKQTIDRLSTEYTNDYKDYSTRRGNFSQLQRRRDKKTNELLAKLEEASKTTENAHVLAAEAKKSGAFTLLSTINAQLEHSINDFYLANLERDNDTYRLLNPAPSPALQKLFVEYGQAAKAYQQANKDLIEVRMTEALNGGLGAELQIAADEDKKLRADVENDRQILENRESHLLTLFEQVDRLKSELVKQFQSASFLMEEISGTDVLDAPTNRWVDRERDLIAIWTRWQAIWRERPPAGKTSLY